MKFKQWGKLVIKTIYLRAIAHAVQLYPGAFLLRNGHIICRAKATNTHANGYAFLDYAGIILGVIGCQHNASIIELVLSIMEEVFWGLDDLAH